MASISTAWGLGNCGLGLEQRLEIGAAAPPHQATTVRQEPATAAPASVDAVSAQELSAGRAALGRYEVAAELDRGGMGVVYRAVDTAFGRLVAVKVIQERFAGQESPRRRFLNEAQITADSRQHARSAPPGGTRRRLRGLLGSISCGAFGETQVMDWGLAKLLEAPPGMAMTFLRRAIAAGYRDFAQLVRDSDLDAMRRLPDPRAQNPGRRRQLPSLERTPHRKGRRGRCGSASPTSLLMQANSAAPIR